MRLTSGGYNIIRTLTGALNDSQVKGIESIVSTANEYNWTYPQCAYALATVYHETARTMQPVTESGSASYLQSKKYYPYIGRGLVQITWLNNYKKFSDLLDIDLVHFPEKALDLKVSLEIMAKGMTKGLFTGKGYNNLPVRSYNKDDYINARRIINGLDKADVIANYAITMERALRGL
ncbi:MAG: hypothetical protein [Caudoviricetes sp.]|nr:MAG: hypothetical protein [Caudoviricetes sp.]